jgi:Protein of unknown function (DUF2844)
MLMVGAVLVVLGTAFPAWAALGGDVTTVQADQLHMQGSIRTTATTAAYTVHEIQSPAGTVVREYISSAGKSAGKVFGIAWQGQWQPDMRQLLGSYFDQYAQAAKARRNSRMRRGPLSIQEPGLTVQMSGHLRSFSGRAYVPEMMPQGVPVEDIR